MLAVTPGRAVARGARGRRRQGSRGAASKTFGGGGLKGVCLVGLELVASVVAVVVARLCVLVAMATAPVVEIVDEAPIVSVVAPLGNLGAALVPRKDTDGL